MACQYEEFTVVLGKVLLLKLTPVRDSLFIQTLLIGTTCNTVYGAEYQERHLPFFQNARLEVIEDAGHFVFYDQPEVTLEVIRQFFQN